MSNKYREIKEAAYKSEMSGIFYAFSDKQFIEGLRKEGYISENETLEDFEKKGIKLATDGFGGYGTKEAFEARDKGYRNISERIKNECTPNEVFAHEWWNHECGLTYNYSEALAITREYFPKYSPTKELLKKLQDQFEKCNNW